MNQYSIATPERLRSLCVRKDWFTCGTSEQYQNLFYANENGRPLEEIATIIWICSDAEINSKQDIITELKKEIEEYLFSLGDEMIAKGERDAEEVYSGYFD